MAVNLDGVFLRNGSLRPVTPVNLGDDGMTEPESREEWMEKGGVRFSEAPLAERKVYHFLLQQPE